MASLDPYRHIGPRQFHQPPHQTRQSLCVGSHIRQKSLAVDGRHVGSMILQQLDGDFNVGLSDRRGWWRWCDI
ncbi:hypothetical protein ACWGM0_19290 (plasmid) [Sphingomonas bisphenolicum]